jgi:hypothetical protein
MVVGDMDKDKSDREFLFIVTYGRSGSTLVMGVLNSIEGYSICGENMDACRLLKDFYYRWYNSIRSFKNNGMPKDSRNSWYQTCDISRLKTCCRNLVWCLCSECKTIDDDRVVGFKEIRWNKKDFEEYLIWLSVIFSPCKFLFITRKLDDVCKSSWHKSESNCLNKLQEFEERMELFRSSHFYLDMFHLHFDDLYNVKPDDFRQLFFWLGEELDEEKLQDVLDRKHSYDGKVKKS